MTIRFGGWRRRVTRDTEIDREIRDHLALEAADRRLDGAAERDAQDGARRAFGSVALTREDTRAVWTWRPIERLTQDLRYAVRSLGHAPAFTIVTLAILALGIGANTTIFSIVNSVLLRPLPYREPDRLMMLDERLLPRFEHFEASPLDVLGWREKGRAFESIAVYGWHRVQQDRRRGAGAHHRHAHYRESAGRARRATDARPRVHRRRGSRGRQSCRDDLARLLAAGARRRPEHGGPRAPPERRRLHRRRRDARRLSLSERDRDLDADGVHETGAHGPEQSLRLGRRTPEAGRYSRAGRGRHGGRHAADADAVERQRHAARRSLRRPRAVCARRAARRGRRRAAHRLRQRRRSAARARVGAAARDQAARVARRQPRAPRATTGHRDDGAGARRRRTGTAAGVAGDWRRACAAAHRYSPARRNVARPARAPLHARRVHGHRPRLRSDTGVSTVANQPAGRTQGRSAGQRRGPHPVATGARRRGAGAGARAARRGRPAARHRVAAAARFGRASPPTTRSRPASTCPPRSTPSSRSDGSSPSRWWSGSSACPASTRPASRTACRSSASATRASPSRPIRPAHRTRAPPRITIGSRRSTSGRCRSR